MQPSLQEGQCPAAVLAIVAARVRLDNAGFEIKVCEPIERKPMLLDVPLVLVRVEFDPTKTTRVA